ncbi:19977_t:CDS:2, partial [Gigaspora margarita]
KKTYSKLSNAWYKEICKYAKARPAARHQNIANKFISKYPMLKLNRSTIIKTLQKSKQYHYLEEINQVSSAGIVLLNELVKLKGCEFDNRLGIPKNDLNVPLETLADKKIKLRQLLFQYEPETYIMLIKLDYFIGYYQIKRWYSKRLLAKK